ncbi:uncharacterized protein LOC110345328 [Heterocephalus glaber]|uniref:Uncharacterized protein LOC110345328 n=1 Tax=Heterocephalus glaber TaxID=10181 RepID=A0AAX6RRY2_HETGA|nr:uncharacterized protein LOC110345328 [Heterocephalus glaber]
MPRVTEFTLHQRAPRLGPGEKGPGEKGPSGDRGDAELYTDTGSTAGDGAQEPGLADHLPAPRPRAWTGRLGRAWRLGGSGRGGDRKSRRESWRLPPREQLEKRAQLCRSLKEWDLRRNPGEVGSSLAEARGPRAWRPPAPEAQAPALGPAAFPLQARGEQASRRAQTCGGEEVQSRELSWGSPDGTPKFQRSEAAQRGHHVSSLVVQIVQPGDLIKCKRQFRTKVSSSVPSPRLCGDSAGLCFPLSSAQSLIRAADSLPSRLVSHHPAKWLRISSAGSIHSNLCFS